MQKQTKLTEKQEKVKNLIAPLVKSIINEQRTSTIIFYFEDGTSDRVPITLGGYLPELPYTHPLQGIEWKYVFNNGQNNINRIGQYAMQEYNEWSVEEGNRNLEIKGKIIKYKIQK